MPSTATDRLSGLSTSVAVKAPCRVATTANITLSGLQTIDGIALADGDRVLVKDQTNTVENGIYVARSSAWERAKDFNGNRDIVTGTAVYVTNGSTQAGAFYSVTTANPITVGSSSISFAVSVAAGNLAAQLASTSNAAHGAGMVGFDATLNYVAGTIGARLASDPIDVTAFPWLAAFDGVTDDTAAIQAALDTGKDVQCPGGGRTGRISDTLYFATEGQVLMGHGKAGVTIIENATTDAPLFTFSTGTGAVYRRRCGIENIEFVGNALTTEGVALRGIVDDLLTGDADKSCWMRNVRIRDVGAGYGLRVASWSNNFYGVEIWSCDKGLLCGSEFNANGFFGLYINGCTNEGIVSPDGAGIPASNAFVNTVVQYCGGTNATVDLQEAYDFNFVGLYLEGNTSPCNVLLASKAHGCTLTGVMHNLTTGTSGMQVIRNEGKGINIHGVINLGGTVDSLVRIEGTLPTTTVSGTHVSVGTATNGEVYDLSTRKATVRLDGTECRLGPTVINALTSQNAIEWRDSAGGTVQAFVRNGAMHFGPDTATGPNIKRSGSSLALESNGSPTAMRLSSLLLGANNVRLIPVAGSPEGATTADVGSIALRTDGGAGTSIYVKESGTGNTGWVGK